MILTDYYKFERKATKAKTRMDCTASTKSYEEFEEKRATKEIKDTEHKDAISVGSLIIYLHDVPPHYGNNQRRRADKSISIKGRNLSSVYVLDPNTNFAFGDFKGTSDALLFVFHDIEIIDGVIQPGGIIEVFIARGKSKDRVPLCNLLSEGQLDEEMNALREKAIQSVTTTDEAK